MAGRQPKNFWYHATALAIVVIWGTTFVATKLLLMAGLSPQDIFFYRFLLAYLCIWWLGRERLWAASAKDEGMLALMGVTGGSLYFLAENAALQYTLVSNVALIMATTPLLTALLTHFADKREKIGRRTVCGSLIAFAGVCLVVFNGNFILSMNPRGDLLSFAAALSWAFYTVIYRKLSGRYSDTFITRKVFFYGLLTILPVFLFRPLNTELQILARPVVWGNLIYLGMVASLLCFLFWNKALGRLGAVRTTNYGYFSPPVALVASAVVIHEPVTWIAAAGAALVLFGVFHAGRPQFR